MWIWCELGDGNGYVTCWEWIIIKEGFFAWKYRRWVLKNRNWYHFILFLVYPSHADGSKTIICIWCLIGWCYNWRQSKTGISDSTCPPVPKIAQKRKNLKDDIMFLLNSGHCNRINSFLIQKELKYYKPHPKMRLTWP